MRSNTDPLTEDPAELDARADEDAREASWDAFVAVVKAHKTKQFFHRRWYDIVEDVRSAMVSAEEYRSDLDWWKKTVFEQACIDFAETEGWDGVLSALARAMREQAKANS